MAQWTFDSDDNAIGKLARLSEAGTDVASSLATYLTLTLSETFASECTGTVSVYSDSVAEQDMITVTYNYQNANFDSYDDGHFEYIIDIFSLLLDHDGNLNFNRRITIFSEENKQLESIGSYTIDSVSAYLLIHDKKSMEEFTLFHIAFD